MTFNDRIVSVIRTYVPSAVGVFIAWLVGKVPAVAGVIAWVDVEFGDLLGGGVVLGLGALATAGVVAGYYAAVRWAAQRWPGLEVLLGSKKAPALYAPPVTSDVQATVVGVVAAAPAVVDAAQSVTDVTVQLTPGDVDPEAVAGAAAAALARQINP